MSPSVWSALRSLRVRQVRRLSALVALAQRSRLAASVVPAARAWYGPRKAFEALAGYRRVFPTLAEAGRHAALYSGECFGTSDYIGLHLELGESARPSDYPVLFHLDRIVDDEMSVFDLGGCIGNLFYCYARYLDRAWDLRWTVHDTPATIEAGRRLSLERGETRLRFTDARGDASGANVLLVSGALHYLPYPLAEYVVSLPIKPRHIFVNRSPLTDGEPCATVQDANGFMMPCALLNRGALVAGLKALDYHLVDAWSVPELSLHIPFFPDYSVAEYSGLYFRRSGGSDTKPWASRPSV